MNRYPQLHFFSRGRRRQVGNKYVNRPHPRPIPDHVARGYQHYDPRPAGNGGRTMTTQALEARRQARRVRSTKHTAKPRRAVTASTVRGGYGR